VLPRQATTDRRPAEDEEPVRDLAPPPIPDPERTPGRTSTDPEDRRAIDHAAVFGAALAAVIVLTIGEGPWDPVDTAIGVLLLLVIGGFYTVPRGVRLLEALAVAAVGTACLSVALAWPLEWALKAGSPPPLDTTATMASCQELSAAALARAQQYPDKTDPYREAERVGGDCRGDVTTTQLVRIAGPIVLIGAFAIWIRGHPPRIGGETSAKGTSVVAPRGNHPRPGVQN
jgi:hypothetical protein